MNSMERTRCNGHKVAEKDSSSSYMTIQDGNNFNASPKDHNVWSSARRNTNHTPYGYFTVLSADPNGIWRAVAVPVNYLNVGVSAGSGSQSFADGTFSGAKSHYHSRNKAFTNKFRRGDVFPGKSSGHSSFNSNDFNVTNFSDISKLGKHGNKNNTKKTKKKGKRNQRRSPDAESTDVAGVLGSATDETGSSNKTDHGAGPVLWETTSTVLSPDSCGDSSEDYCSGSAIYSETSKNFNTNVEKVDKLEDSLYDSLSCMEDPGSRILSEADNSLVLGSISDCLKAGDVAISSNFSMDMRHKGGRKVPRNSSVSKKSSFGKFPEQNHNVSQTRIWSTGEDRNQSKVRNFGKMKRNTSAGTKQELNCHWRKSSYASKSTSDICSKIDTELNNEIGISRPPPKVSCTEIESGGDKIEPSACGYVKLEGCSSKVECKLTQTDSGDANQIDLLDFSATKHNSNNQVSGPFMHKWVAIGSKDSELSRSAFSNSSQSAKVSKENFDLESTTTKMASSETCNDSDMILLAVNDAYKAQLALEAVEKDIGCTVAEVERFLRAASPVIPLPDNNISNLYLRNLWEWYEKHGIFGLEVKAEDYDNSKRLGMDRTQFRAYFVPFLSAVQLFRRRRCSSDNDAKVFSILVPKSKIVGSDAKEVDDCAISDELELIYEYFEAERPQQRSPLFEMMNDLVSDNEPLKGRGFGDPSKLDSMAFNDLHPMSWYSVAWYPIYRIPDEKFHSAFLTYHSLGHLVHGNATSDCFAGNACVASPVVGLQSYNTQGECWLQPRNLTKQIPNYNHIEILNERLRTLEHTASVMARAQVVKGNATSVNRQPDYEFFLSRRYW